MSYEMAGVVGALIGTVLAVVICVVFSVPSGLAVLVGLALGGCGALVGSEMWGTW